MRRCSGTILLLLLGTVGLGRPQTPALPKDVLPASIDVSSIPLGLPRERATPKDSPLTGDRVQLGRKLFFDPILSVDQTVACASCHDPAHGFSSREPRAVGVAGKAGRRNAPSLLNRAFATSLFWDGRESSLETQALKPIQDPLEMGNSLPEAVRRLRNHPDYPALFKQAFNDGVSPDNIAKALASFQRTLLLGDTRVDRFRQGEVGGLSDTQRHGLWLWESKGRCWMCHSGSNFSDERFHNTGVGWGREPVDLGRFEVTKKESDRGRFRTPTLRGTAFTAPYMHDGSVATLKEVVEYYNRGGNKNPQLDPAIVPLGLSGEELNSLVAFLEVLSDGTGPALPKIEKQK